MLILIVFFIFYFISGRGFWKLGRGCRW